MLLDLPVIESKPRQPRPEWLKVRIPSGENYSRLNKIMREHDLHTVCEEARCPNVAECWNAGTATFMILGDTCTRSCGFCAVKTGRPALTDWSEPERIAHSVSLMEVKHCVITSVDRDDLADGGSVIWALTVQAIRQ